jgi:CshA-type fibril repeat protein
VTIPVTTPITGATEPDRADFNPDPVNVANEKAVATIAIKGQRKDIATALSSTEPPGVTLEIPGSLGPIGPPPDPSALTTSGVGTAQHTTTVTPPAGGTVHLLDGTELVSTLVVTGVGTYTVDPATGEMTFDPEPGYSGTAPAVGYRVTDAYGQTGDNTWTATVTMPDAPMAPNLTSSGPIRTDQQVTLSIPTGGSVRLLDGSVAVSLLTVPGVGTYSLNTSTGVVTFTPTTLFRGVAPAVDYRVTDAYDQAAEGSYTPTVTLAALTATPLDLNGVGEQLQSGTLTLPPLSTAHLLDGTTPVNSFVVPGKGTFTVTPSKGAVTFQPVPGFSGVATAPYRFTDEFGQTAESTIVATVARPAPPTAQNRTSTSTPEQPFLPQTATFTVPPGTTISLIDPSGNPVDSLAVPGQGTYVLDPDTGVVTFTPIDGYRGAVTPVPVRLTDGYGQSATGSYSPAIGRFTPTTLAPERGEPSTRPSITIPIPPGGSVTLIDAEGREVTEVTIPGMGTYVLDPDTGVLTFVPAEGFEGSPTSVTYKITDADGRVSIGTFSPTVLGDSTDRGDTREPVAPLAFTGAATSTLAGLGALVLCIGMALMGLSRRRRQATH